MLIMLNYKNILIMLLFLLVCLNPRKPLIRLQRIYNFSLFHDIILPLLDVYGLYFTHLYHFWD